MTGREHLAVRAPAERVDAALLATGDLPVDVVVGPTDDRWCGVAGVGGGTDCGRLAADLSAALSAPVVVAEVAEALGVRLFVWGEEIVTYSSADAGGPADALRWAGAVERLIDATGASALPEDVSRVLCGSYPDAASRYADLVAALGLPGYLATGEWTG